MSKLFTPIQAVIDEFLPPKPKKIDYVMNLSAHYYQRQLLNKIIGRYNITGMPKDWDRDYFYETYFIKGYICVTDTPVGVVPLECGYRGYNIFNRPVTCQITNAYLASIGHGNIERTIGVDCVLMRLNPWYIGFSDIIDRYAYLLASCDSAISVNLMNSKVTTVFKANNEKQSKELKMLYDEITMGKPAVFTDALGDGIGSSRSSVEFMPAKQNYISDLILETKRNIMNQFLTEIGVNNANVDKKERLVKDEVNSNNMDLEVSTREVEINIREGLEAVNMMFGYDLKLEDFYKEEKKDVLQSDKLSGVQPGPV